MNTKLTYFAFTDKGINFVVHLKTLYTMSKQVSYFILIIILINYNTAFPQLNHSPKKNNHMTTAQIKSNAVGSWQSIATEIRPSNQKNTDGTLKPFYLKRVFTLNADNTFELQVTNFADPNGKVPLALMTIKGSIQWQGEHPLIEGAQKVDFTADKDYEVTPLIQGFADVLNSATSGYNPWEVGKAQSIFKKSFAPFGLKEGDIFKEYDLIYVADNHLFWGARNVDGRGFDTEANRPTNLQIPLIRK